MKFASKLSIGTIAFAATVSCGADFRPKNAVEGVRILAAKADQPYVKPGEMVHIEALAYDGRAPSPNNEPMRLFWFPAPCIDPPGAQHWVCFSFFEALFPMGVDLTSQLHEAKDLTAPIPADVLSRAIVRPGQTTSERFSTAFFFVVACAGHVERVQRPNNQGPNSLPLACFSSSGIRLGPESFVLGYTRVFVFENRTNAIPNFDNVTFEGQPIDPAKGIVTGKCVKNKNTDECNTVKLDVAFSDAAAEVDPDNIGPNGEVGRETIYVDWFTTLGKFSTDRKILFDGNLGRPKKTEIEFSPPDNPAKGTVWAILHDNRGGTTWREMALEIQ